MKIYKDRPTPRKARKIWDYITKKRGKSPLALWKNPNCWQRPSVVGNAWGWWVAEFGVNDYEPIHPDEPDWPCKHDTDGDGDCHICHKSGGCFLRQGRP